MTHYEMLIVLPGTLTEVEVTPVITHLTETIAKFGGVQVTTHDMGKSRLAYPMKHIRYGYFFLVRFESEPTVLNEIKAKVQLIGNILRLVVRAFDPAKHSMDTSRLNLTPLANVVGDGEVPAREFRRDPQPTPGMMIKKPVLTEEKVVTAEPSVSMEDIEEKLDQILEKDLEKV